MICINCKTEVKDILGKFSIEKTKLCPTCYKEKCELAAIEAAKPTFEVTVSYSHTFTIKADCEDDAIMEATESVDGSDFDAYARMIKEGEIV